MLTFRQNRAKSSAHASPPPTRSRWRRRLPERRPSRRSDPCMPHWTCGMYSAEGRPACSRTRRSQQLSDVDVNTGRTRCGRGRGQWPAPPTLRPGGGFNSGERIQAGRGIEPIVVPGRIRLRIETHATRAGEHREVGDGRDRATCADVLQCMCRARTGEQQCGCRRTGDDCAEGRRDQLLVSMCGVHDALRSVGRPVGAAIAASTDRGDGYRSQLLHGPPSAR